MNLQISLFSFGLILQLLVGCWATSSSSLSSDGIISDKEEAVQAQLANLRLIESSETRPSQNLPPLRIDVEGGQARRGSESKRLSPSLPIQADPSKRSKRVHFSVDDAQRLPASSPSGFQSSRSASKRADGFAATRRRQRTSSLRAARPLHLNTGAQRLPEPSSSYRGDLVPRPPGAQEAGPSQSRDAQGTAGPSSHMVLSSSSLGKEASPSASWVPVFSSAGSEAGSSSQSHRVPALPTSITRELPDLPNVEAKESFANGWNLYRQQHTGPFSTLFQRPLPYYLLLHEYKSRIQQLNILKKHTRNHLATLLSKDDNLRLQDIIGFHPWQLTYEGIESSQLPVYKSLIRAEKLYAAEVEEILQRVADKISHQHRPTV